MNRYDLTDKVVIITGAGGAIGSAMAHAFAKNGAKVAVADLADTRETVAQEIIAQGGEAMAVPVDVSDKASTMAMADAVMAKWGRIDVLINNAGINGGPDQRKPIHEYDDNLWHRIMKVDLDGVYYCSKAAIPHIAKQGGTIINIGSIVGQTPLRLQCAFAAAKAAVLHLTKAMALELAPLDITVNAIAPGSILFEGTKALFYADPEKAKAMTSHIPQGHPGEADDVCGLAMFLASKDAKYMTGTVNTVDGGWICGYARDF